MQTSLNCLLLFITFSQLTNAFNMEILLNFYSYKHVGFLNIYHCFNLKTQVSIVKELSGRDKNVRMFNIHDNLTISASDIYREHDTPLGYVFDGVNCKLDHVLPQFGAKRAFSLAHPTLIFLESPKRFQNLFLNLVMSVSTDLKVVTNDRAVYDVYNPSTLHGGHLNITLYPHWNPITYKFRKVHTDNLYWTRRNMSGIFFREMVVLPKVFPGRVEDYLATDANRGVNSYNRFHAMVTDHVRDFYGYEYNVTWTKSWGFKMANGTFDGLVGALEGGRVDFGASPLFVKNERVPAVQYGRRTWNLRAAFLFRAPKRPASFHMFLRPLDGPVWYLTIVSCIVIVAMLKLSLRTEHADEKCFDSSWSHLTLFTIGALCQQGASTCPNGLSTRISFIFIFIFFVLLYQYYSASIVSILISSPSKFIKTLADLAQSSMTMGCDDVGYNRDYFLKMEHDPVITALPKKSPRGSPFYDEPEIGIPRVALGGYAFHVELAAAYPIIARTYDEEQICSLDLIELFPLQQLHHATQRNSHFKEMFDYELHRIDEAGLMNRLMKHWHARKPECIRSPPPTAVSVEYFYPALSMLMLGIVSSTLILILECALSRYNYHTRHS